MITTRAEVHFIQKSLCVRVQKTLDHKEPTVWSGLCGNSKQYLIVPQQENWVPVLIHIAGDIELRCEAVNSGKVKYYVWNAVAAKMWLCEGWIWGQGLLGSNPSFTTITSIDKELNLSKFPYL